MSANTYAQHVYTSLPERQTVLDYLEYKAMPGTTFQDIMAQAGALLFRDDHIKKKISVLSGGERARLCLAGLLLGNYNILVLDEPGNHLDVETVEVLANALLAFRGTTIFTSHDRHFMKRIATSVIEVRDGNAKNYAGGYDAYLYAVNKEIDEGERDENARKSNSGKRIPGLRSAQPMPKTNRGRAHRDQRKLRKEINNIERKIARLDEQQREINDQLLQATDPEEALRLHNEVTSITNAVAKAEDRWLELQEEHGEIEGST